ncbi:MAG: type IV pilus biogenesis/stability protein PilW [Pseudomonadota bacterium]
MKQIIKVICVVGMSLLVGCSGKPSYIDQTQRVKNVVCAKNIMNFDRNLAAEKRLQIATHKISHGQVEMGKKNLDCALKYAPEKPIVHRVYGYYFEFVGETEQAEAAYKYALKLSPNDPDSLNQYGVFLCKNQQYDKAIKHFLKAISIPSYTQVSSSFENAGICSVESGNVTQAESFFRKALSYDRDSKKSLLEMADIYFKKANLQVAHSYISRYMKVAKHSPRSLWLAMRIEKERGDNNALGSYAVKLEQMFPDSEETAQYQEIKQKWQR